MPKLTNEDIWGEVQKKLDSFVEDQVNLICMKVGETHRKHFGYDICNNCKFEIDRSQGLKEVCPKCHKALRNPV